MVFGLDNAYLSIIKKKDGEYIQLKICMAADKGTHAQTVFSQKINSKEMYLKLDVNKGAGCHFSFSEDGKRFQSIAISFTAKPGKWVGAKLGLFATGTTITNDVGYADVDFFRIETINNSLK